MSLYTAAMAPPPVRRPTVPEEDRSLDRALDALEAESKTLAALCAETARTIRALQTGPRGGE